MRKFTVVRSNRHTPASRSNPDTAHPMKRIFVCLTFVFCISVLRAQDKPAEGNRQSALVVHEWGTFTSLQDEKGNAIPGINTDDEPVPPFVHRLGNNLIAPQRTNFPGQQIFTMDYKIPGVVQPDPDVLVRLETPVIYFYPPAGWEAQAVDVHVAYPGGWLSEFYPNAVSKAPGFLQGGPGKLVGHLSGDATGELSWTGLVVGGDGGTTPSTESKVWLAPRAVKATPVVAANGEREKFLFYRGVGNVEPALRVARNGTGGLEVRDNECQQVSNIREAQRIHAAWLVDVRADGACAFKALGAVEPAQGVRATMPGGFDAREYSAENMAALRGEMHTALVGGGLFADEAEAMLNTWEVSYFKSPGLRFFYLCPRTQIDAALPLQISVAATISRVMIGRVEIVTPGQRALLKEISSGPGAEKQNRDYTSLGRFRNALVLDEQKHSPTAALNDFIGRNGLGAYDAAPPRRALAGTYGMAALVASALMVALRFGVKAGRRLLPQRRA